MIPTYYGYFFASFTYQICQRSQSTNERIHGSAEFVEKCFASVSGGCCGGGCRYCPLIISYIQLCHLPNCTPSLSSSFSLYVYHPLFSPIVIVTDTFQEYLILVFAF